MSDKKSNSSKRTRNFSCVVYPESAPDNWVQILQESFVQCFISPLHDKDLNPTGEPKKPHYHVMAMYDGPKTNEQAKELFESFGGVGCEVIQSVRGYARYLCHLDNPEKHQYSESDVTSLNGADYMGVIGLVTDKYKAIGEIIEFCMSNGITSYAELLLYCKMHRYDWFRVLCDNGTYVVMEFLKSVEWTNKQEGGEE